jgi:hypothetical protein
VLALRAAALVAALGVVVAFGSGCRACRGTVNASPGLRWWLFSNYGASQMCPELLKHGMGLRLQDRGPAVGRFFPTSCAIEVNDDSQTVTLNFVGMGYAFTHITKRLGFTASASVQYRPDFYMAENDIYVWGKVNSMVRGPDFKLGYVENKVVDLTTALTPLGGLANLFGNQVAAGALTRGFTVVENYDTETKTFGLGIFEPPRKPTTPYNVDADEVHTFANEQIEVQYNQRDFLGPFEIVDDDQELQVKMVVQGPPVDLIVVDRRVGDPWRDSYQQGLPLGQPSGAILYNVALQSTHELRTAFRLPPGQYYIVVDHTPYAGKVMPPPLGLLSPVTGGPKAVISYVAQLGEI